VGRTPEIVAAGRLVLIADPTEGVAAIDPLDGREVWTSHQFPLLWILGADEKHVWLQAPTGVATLRLDDGTPAWSTPAAIGPPSGRGLTVGNRIYVPLADGALAVLDAGNGRPVEMRPGDAKEPLGNLIVVGGSLVSQSATRIRSLPVGR
jgi:hypothetical protein